MAESDCAAIDVRLRAIEAEFSFDGEVLAGERLVDFDEINLFELQTCLLKCLANRGHGADAHQVRLDTRVGPTDDAAQRLHAALTDKLLARDDEHRRAVNNAESVASRDERYTAECRAQLRQDFVRRCGARGGV